MAPKELRTEKKQNKGTPINQSKQRTNTIVKRIKININKQKERNEHAKKNNKKKNKQ